jgi:hypothetical protein
MEPTVNDKVPNDGLPDYSYEAATEGERWAYDQGFEAGHQAALDPIEQGLDGIEALLQAAIAALTVIIAEEKRRRAGSEDQK